MRALTLILFSLTLQAAAATVPFDEALSTILKRSTAVGIQKAVMEQTEARNLSDHLTLLPSLNVEALNTYSRIQGPPTTSRLGIQGRADLNLFKFGADAAAMSAANREEEAQQEVVNDTVLGVEEQGVSALVAVIRADLETGIQNQLVEIRETSLDIARKRYRRGLLPQEEVDKIQVDLDNARAREKDAEIAALSARETLQPLLGKGEVEAAWPWMDRLDGFTAGDGSDNVLSKRPDWMSARLSLEAADERKDQSWGTMLPSLDANFTYGYFSNRINTTSSGTEWRGGLSLTIPLFDRLARYGGYREGVYRRAQAELAFEQVKRAARAEWKAARGSFETSLATARSRAETLKVSRTLYETQLKRFRQGRANANELNVDQERLLSSELLAIRGWATVHNNFTRLCHSVGKRVPECLKPTAPE